jgi:hypothetical protein
MAFTTTFKTMYEAYANGMNDAYEYLTLAGPAAVVSRDAVVDIVAGDGIVDGTSDTGYQIEIALLSVINGFALQTAALGGNTYMIPAVSAINNLVINRSDSTALTAKLKLDEFVNSLTWACVPVYWCALCEAAGFDTSGWNCCSS